MPTILTAAEAALVLRTVDTDPRLPGVLADVDDYIKNATGHDWASDVIIEPAAKAAARIYAVLLFENPGQMANGQGMLPQGLTAKLTQLEALARVMTFTGINGSGYCSLPGAEVGEIVAGLRRIAPTAVNAIADFESIITLAGYIKQTSTSDLSENTYRVRLTSPVMP